MKVFDLDADDSLDKMCGKVFSTVKGVIVFICFFCEDKYSCGEDFLLHLSQAHITSEENEQIAGVSETDEQSDLEPLVRKRSADLPASTSVTNDHENVVYKIKASALIQSTEEEFGQNDPLAIDCDESDSKVKEELEHSDDDSKPWHSKLEPPNMPIKEEQPNDLQITGSSLKKSAKESRAVKNSCHKSHILSYTAKDHQKSKKNYSSTETTGRPIKCLQCHAAFLDVDSFRGHLKGHNNYQCPKCSAGFILKRKFDEHMDAFSVDLTCGAERLHKCIFCDFAFHTNAKLNVHLRLHFDDKNYQCQECPKKFVSRLGLKYHMIVHSKEKPYECNICSAKFAHRSNLRGHEMRHSEENKIFPCKDCDKKFFTRREVLLHSRVIHTKEQPYLCSDCGVSFPLFARLKNHKLVHHGAREKKYKCDVCPKTTFTKDNLRRHMESHLEERKHVCSTCNAAFKTKQTLRSHSKSHANKREFVCELCQKGFNHRETLKKHIRTIHEKIK